MSNRTRWLAIGGAAVIGVALLSAQQTGALWTQTERLDAGTVTSGILDLGVGGSGLSSYPFTALSGANLTPGGYAQAPVTIHNSGDVLMRYQLLSAEQSNPALPLELSVTLVGAANACPAAGDVLGAPLYTGPLVGATFLQRAVEPGATEVLCLRGTVGADAPHSQSTTATFTFSAQSR
ncbi:hypothetical protein ACFWPA_13020 [Rhodococcus sp. NPDC058505]|uniref:hypothetical protein n=1 Tax=unclassified Rhodococcus (in: high G+C Gram-positive bacteria) TaxID=192944 RepID=UPI00364B5F2D